MPDPILPRVAAGEALAVQECIDRYGGLVWSLARRFCANRQEAEDAVQEVLIELWTKAGRYDARLASEITFVAMIARRRLIDRGRKKQRTVESADIEDRVTGADLGQERVELCDEAAHAAKAFAHLRPEQQRVLKLAIFDGLSHEQIAQATKLPLGTVKTHARRGLARLRELLGLARTADAQGASS